MNNNLNFEAVKGYHLNLRELNDEQILFLKENLIKCDDDFSADDTLFHYGFSAPHNEYRFFNFTCFSIGQESEKISFDEYVNKLNILKPEYDPKDVAFNQRTVIGYKLIKPEYKRAVREILKSSNNRNWFDHYFENNIKTLGYNFGNDQFNNIKENMKIAGVMHWFYPVYEKETIRLKSGVKLSEEDIAEVKEILNNK